MKIKALPHSQITYTLSFAYQNIKNKMLQIMNDTMVDSSKTSTPVDLFVTDFSTNRPEYTQNCEVKG